MSEYKEVRPKTIFSDIDGTLVKHVSPFESAKRSHKMELLPGTIKKLEEWDMKGYSIILTTGRKESCRKVLEKQLSDAGIMYDQLIMGIGGGQRVLINDTKPYGDFDTATGINLDRNQGISELEI
jgi:ribonucleotide monophosphatase NagD (HAD superfamily)